MKCFENSRIDKYCQKLCSDASLQLFPCESLCQEVIYKLLHNWFGDLSFWTFVITSIIWDVNQHQLRWNRLAPLSGFGITFTTEVIVTTLCATPSILPSPDWPQPSQPQPPPWPSFFSIGCSCGCGGKSCNCNIPRRRPAMPSLSVTMMKPSSGLPPPPC